MRLLALALLSAMPPVARDRAGEVRQAEIAFAKAFADRDPVKFFGFVAEDAHFLSSGRTLSGKEEVKSVWSGYLKDKRAPFSWSPERVVVNARGDLGLSTGPVLDASGRHVGDYSSIWQRQSDGGWKVIFDGPGAEVCEQPKK